MRHDGLRWVRGGHIVTGVFRAYGIARNRAYPTRCGNQADMRGKSLAEGHTHPSLGNAPGSDAQSGCLAESEEVGVGRATSGWRFFRQAFPSSGRTELHTSSGGPLKPALLSPQKCGMRHLFFLPLLGTGVPKAITVCLNVINAEDVSGRRWTCYRERQQWPCSARRLAERATHLRADARNGVARDNQG